MCVRACGGEGGEGDGDRELFIIPGWSAERVTDPTNHPSNSDKRYLCTELRAIVLQVSRGTILRLISDEKKVDFPRFHFLKFWLVIIIIIIIFIEDTNFTRSDLQKGPLQDYNIINYKIKMYINYIVYVKYILKLKLRATNYNNKKNYKTT